MVPGFSRSISLTLTPTRSGKNSRAISYHKRSASLPCCSHPIISHLEEQIQDIQSWSANPDASSVCIEGGLAKIETLLTSLEELLHLGRTQEILRCAASTDSLLDNFILLADIYGSFVSTLVTLTKTSGTMRLFRTLALNSLSNSRVSDEEFGVAEKLDELDECVRNVASCSEQVFKKHINLRVSLLNIRTPSL